MKNACKTALKSYMSKRFIAARRNSDLTQAKFSEKLMMDTRSYSDLEHGYSLCCTLTFILYLCYFCDDIDTLREDLRKILVDAQNIEYPAC